MKKIEYKIIMEKHITRTCENIPGIFDACCYALLKNCLEKYIKKRKKEMSGKLEIENREPQID